MDFNIDSVKQRLKSFGYESGADDVFALDFSISKVTETIKNETNQSVIPYDLNAYAVDMACGEFLQAKRTFMPSSLNLDLDMAIKQISVGDTSTTYDVSSSDDKKLGLFINYLLHCGDSEYPKYRRLSW